MIKSSPKCPRPKGGKDGQKVSKETIISIKNDHERGDQEARVSAVL